MRLFDPQSEAEPAAAVARMSVLPDHADHPRSLWFRFAGAVPDEESILDAGTVAMLPYCMSEGEACHVDGPLSDVLARNAGRAQEKLSGWYKSLTRVEIRPRTLRERSTGQNRAEGVACCFSGGVDSWYSLLRNEPSVTHLLLVRGFDIGLQNDRLWNQARARSAEVARRLGLSLVTCETNLRSIADKGRAGWGAPYPGDFWGKYLHGAALCAVALLLSRSVGSFIIPATHSIGQLKPWGSSPELDPHWSNGRVTITHDGCEAGRAEKIRTIAECDIALQNLRVCHNDEAEMNCGRCEKCIRTMLALRLHGGLDRAETFANTGALRRLNRLEVPAHLHHHYEDLLALAEQVGDEAITRGIEAILGRRFSTERSLATIVRKVRRSQQPATRSHHAR